jgi:hypothetical protein
LFSACTVAWFDVARRQQRLARDLGARRGSGFKRRTDPPRRHGFQAGGSRSDAPPAVAEALIVDRRESVVDGGIMSIDNTPREQPRTDIVRELENRVEAELPMLAAHLRTWLQAHRTHPREISVSSDPEGVSRMRVWLVTHHTGDQDASSMVVYDGRRKMFGLMMELQNGVLWHIGVYGSLVDTIRAL